MGFSNLFLVLAIAGSVSCQSGLLGLINPRDIADLTQMAMTLGAQTVRSNQELMSKPGRPEVKPLSSGLSASELFGQGLTNLMNPEATMRMLNGNNSPAPKTPSPRGPTLPIERRQEVGEPVADLPREFGSEGFFKPDRLFSTLQRPRANAARSVDAAPVESIANIGGEPPIELKAAPAPVKPAANIFGSGMTPEMESGGRSLMKLASTFLRGAGGEGEDFRDAPRSRSGFGRDENMIPNIRDVLPGARDNFGVRNGRGCLPFVGEFMQMAYGNCVKHADQKTFDAWGREFESAVTGRGLNLFRASKETCRMVAEREQCGQLRKAVSNCDIINSIQIAMNMQRALERCDQVTGIIDQNPAAIVDGMSGLINGEVAQGFLNNFLG